MQILYVIIIAVIIGVVIIIGNAGHKISQEEEILQKIFRERNSIKCPNCGVDNSITALRCHCGYDFINEQMKEPFKMLIDRRNNNNIFPETKILRILLGILFLFSIIGISSYLALLLTASSGLGFFILAALLITTMNICLLGSLWATWKAYVSQFWHVTKGKIIQSRLKEYEGYEEHYAPEIIYEYIIDEAIYSSNQITFGYTSKEHLNLFPLGKIVNVYYKPDNPKVAVLKPGFSKEYKRHSLFALLLILIAIIAVTYLYF